MKTERIVSLVFALTFFLFLPRGARANEGLADLRGSGVSGACFVSSIYIDGSYKVMATCRELKMALSPEKNKYLLWAEDETGKQKRLGELVGGKLFGQTDQKFLKLFVTAERDGYVNKPSEDVFLIGQMREIDFGPGVAPVKTIITPTPTQTKAAVVDQNKDVKVTEGNGLGSAVSTVFKIVLLGFGALLVVVGVMSFLSRRRSL